jgi:hypothetical protein
LLQKHPLILPTPAGHLFVHPDYTSLLYTSDLSFSAMTHGHLLGRAPTAEKNTYIVQKIAHLTISALQGRSFFPLQQVARLWVEEQFRPAGKLHAVDDARRRALARPSAASRGAAQASHRARGKAGQQRAGVVHLVVLVCSSDRFRIAGVAEARL